jgi:hypothetical protein
MIVLRFETLQGDPIALLFSFGRGSAELPREKVVEQLRS